MLIYIYMQYIGRYAVYPARAIDSRSTADVGFVHVNGIGLDRWFFEVKTSLAALCCCALFSWWVKNVKFASGHAWPDRKFVRPRESRLICNCTTKTLHTLSILLYLKIYFLQNIENKLLNSNKFSKLKSDFFFFFFTNPCAYPLYR